MTLLCVWAKVKTITHVRSAIFHGDVLADVSTVGGTVGRWGLCEGGVRGRLRRRVRLEQTALQSGVEHHLQ